MRKNCITLLILFTLWFVPFTQTLCQTPNRIRIGASAGIDKVNYRNDLGGSNSSFGFTSGLNLEFLATDHLSYSAGVAYADRTLQGGMAWTIDPRHPIPENRFSIRYLKVLEFSPVTIRYRLNSKTNQAKFNPFLQMGLLASFAFSDKREVFTDTGTIFRNYPGFKSYKQGMEFGVGGEYALNKKAFLLLLFTSRFNRVTEEYNRIVQESPFDKIALQAGFSYNL